MPLVGKTTLHQSNSRAFFDYEQPSQRRRLSLSDEEWKYEQSLSQFFTSLDELQGILCVRLPVLLVFLHWKALKPTRE